MTTEPEDLSIGESIETEPGVVVERRSVLKTLAALLATAAVPGVTPIRAHSSESATLSIEEFIEEAVPVAKKLLADTSLAGQDRYLLTIASIAIRLADVPVPELRDSGQGTGPGTYIGSNGAPGPFVILHWKMNPGTEIRRHAHAYGNVVTLGLDGAARVENFEVAGERDYDTEDSFRVRRTVDQLLARGGTNLVNLERNYIHGFRASDEGARGLDITTKIRDKRPTPYLELGKGLDDGLFEAHWTD